MARRGHMPGTGEQPGIADTRAADLLVGGPRDGAIRLAARGDHVAVGQTRAYVAPVFTGPFRSYTVRRRPTGGRRET